MNARHPLTRLALALLLAACAACSPDGLYAVNAGSLSAGVLVDGCKVSVGYYDTATGKNNSWEWEPCR